MTAFAPGELDRFAALYPNRPGKLNHGLSGHPLLTLEALVELGRRMDPVEVEYNAGDLPIGIDPEAIAANGLSIEETIRGIEQCGSWMVLKRIESDPAYKVLLEDTLAELEGIVGASTGEMLTRQGFIFISSPGAVTPFHMDPEHNILLQIRGRKTITIFPGDARVVPDALHEAYHAGSHRNLPWQERFADVGEPFELTPGEAVHVPVKRPHWVKNGPEPSISLSITWRSHWTYEEADARGMNRLLRQWGMEPEAPAPFPARNPAKAYAFRAIRKAKQVVGR